MSKGSNKILYIGIDETNVGKEVTFYCAFATSNPGYSPSKITRINKIPQSNGNRCLIYHLSLEDISKILYELKTNIKPGTILYTLPYIFLIQKAYKIAQEEYLGGLEVIIDGGERHQIKKICNELLLPTPSFLVKGDSINPLLITADTIAGLVLREYRYKKRIPKISKEIPLEWIEDHIRYLEEIKNKKKRIQRTIKNMPLTAR